MSPRKHHYDPDAGGIRHAKRRAVADRTALGPDTRKSGCGLWLFAFVPAAIVLTSIIGGQIFGWLS